MQMRVYGNLSPGDGALLITFFTDARMGRTVAITPNKTRSMDFEDVRKVCCDYALAGLKTMVEARESSTGSFRFIYMSGTAAERDPTKTPRFMPQYSLMRVRTSPPLQVGVAGRRSKRKD